MAIIKSDLFNEMSGRVGRNLFAYTRMGQVILRRGPGPRKKSSTAQEVCMSSVTCMNMLYSAVRRIMKWEVWKLAGAPHGKMANNYFARVNKGIFDERRQIRSYSQLVLTEGTLCNPAGMAVNYTGEGLRYEVTWVAEDGPGARAGTSELQVILLLDHPREDFFGFYQNWAIDVEGTRGEGRGSFTVDENFVDLARRKGIAMLQVYCFFAAPDRTAFSRSTHFEIPLDDAVVVHEK